MYLSDILLLVGLAFWAAGRYLSSVQGFSYGPSYVYLPLLFLVVLTMLSIIWAVDGRQAGYITVRSFLLLALYLAMVNESSRTIALMATVLFGIGALHSGVALAQVVGGSAAGLPQLGEIRVGDLGYEVIGSPRAFGLGFNPNPVGLYLATVSALAYGLFLLHLGGWWRQALVALFFIGSFLGLTATQSRSALLGWLLGFLVVSLLGWLAGGQARRTTLKRVGIGILLVIISASFLHLATPSDKLSEGSGLRASSSVITRLTIENLWGGLKTRVGDYELSMPIIRDNPILGVGAGDYPFALKTRVSPDRVGGIFVPIHNVPMLIVAELGVVGGAAWTLVMIAPVVWAVSSRSLPRFGFLSLVWLGPLVVVLFVSLLDFPPWATQDGRVLLWAMLGLWEGGIADSSEANSVAQDED